MNKTVIILCFWLLGSLKCGEPFNPDIFEAKIYRNPKGESLPYRLLKPIKPIKGKRYPLVIFFHGAGERGNDNSRQLCNGVQLFVQPESLKDYPCYMLVPQCPAGLRWVDTDWKLDAHTMPDTPSYPMRLAMELVDEVIRTEKIDTTRIYITGVSMGGFAVWDAIMRQPERYAAAVPVCGGADDTKAALVVNVPVWAFHGGKDKVVKTIRSRHIIEALNKAGGHPNYTEFPTIGHNAWDSAYCSPELLRWMFRHRN